MFISEHVYFYTQPITSRNTMITSFISRCMCWDYICNKLILVDVFSLCVSTNTNCAVQWCCTFVDLLPHMLPGHMSLFEVCKQISSSFASSQMDLKMQWQGPDSWLKCVCYSNNFFDMRCRNWSGSSLSSSFFWLKTSPRKPVTTQNGVCRAAVVNVTDGCFYWQNHDEEQPPGTLPPPPPPHPQQFCVWTGISVGEKLLASH